MQLDNISANVRYRTAWEGLDLGFVMARHWFLPLWGLWWVTAVPVLLLCLASYWVFESTVLITVLIWWFKPLYEPMLLYWLSRRLFGEHLSVREVLGAWRKVLLPRLLANLTLFRFSPNRSFYMPVSHLEGLRREERRKRLRVLRGSQSAGAWLTIVGAHIEWALALGFLGLVLFLTPEQFLPDNVFNAMGDNQHWLGMLNHLFWFISLSIFAPFYVAGGFALYLTRRSQLEAWDLELAFRRMQPRFKGKGDRLSRSLLASLLAGALLLPLAQSGQAAEVPSREESQRIITEVLDDEVFGTTEQKSYWRKLSDSDDPEEEDPENSSTDWIRALAEFMEYLAWTAVVIGVGFLIYYLGRLLDWLPEGRQQKESGTDKPSVLFGMPITPESLPEDIPAAIRQLLESGRIRQALGLLYRATLARLVHEGQLRIPDSATEGECRTLVAAARPAPEADYFGRLTNLWIRCAYGHLDPRAEQILTLADTWQGLYRGEENG
jgi:hypothetical protein